MVQLTPPCFYSIQKNLLVEKLHQPDDSLQFFWWGQTLSTPRRANATSGGETNGIFRIPMLGSTYPRVYRIQIQQLVEKLAQQEVFSSFFLCVSHNGAFQVRNPISPLIWSHSHHLNQPKRLICWGDMLQTCLNMFENNNTLFSSTLVSLHFTMIQHVPW